LTLFGVAAMTGIAGIYAIAKRARLGASTKKRTALAVSPLRLAYHRG